MVVGCLELLFGPLLFDDLPGHICQVSHLGYVFFRVIQSLVANAKNGNNLVFAHHRNHKFTNNICMAFRHSLFAWHREIIIVYDWFFFSCAICPDAGLCNWVMGTLAFGFAEIF